MKYIIDIEYKKPGRFWDSNPTLIGTVAGVRFYEHPQFGDEYPLIAVLPGGDVGLSCFWEVPDIEDLEDLVPGGKS